MSTTPDGAPEPGDEDVDARFRSIIDAEFGAEPPRAPRPVRRPTPPRPVQSPVDLPRPDVARPTGGDDFSMSRAMDEVTPDEPDEPFVPPEPDPLPTPRNRVVLGAVLLGVSLVTMLMSLFGATLPGWAGPAAVVAFAVGLTVLLFSVSRTPRDPWDDGTRV